MKKKYLWGGLLIALATVAYFGARQYQKWLAPNVLRSGKLYIPTGADYTQVLDSLASFLKHEKTFDWLARRKNYPAAIKSGRYTLAKNENNKTLVHQLLIGAEDEIAIRIGNYVSIFQMAGRIAPFLECDSSEIISAILNSTYSKKVDTAAMIYFFLPNTYNFHWDLSGTQFVSRMIREYDKFWNKERTRAADSQQLTKFEVITLASIVQLESAVPEEQPKVAALYLNRLRRGMKLDADPTVIYALMKEDPTQTIQRVYYKDLRIASPYNTYRHKGLPPGPICMPNPSAIDAVLHPDHHDFLYFVANPQRPGYHIYAKTLKEQEQNAEKYRDWLDKHEIK